LLGLTSSCGFPHRRVRHADAGGPLAQHRKPRRGEAAYAKRRAELRAEADAADERLQLLDKRVNLISLGFRDVVRKVAPASSTSPASPTAATRRPRQQGLAGSPRRRHGQAALPGRHRLGLHRRAQLDPHQQPVVQHAHRLRVTFYGGYTLTVGEERIHTDPLTDLAAVHLPPSPPAVLREDDTLRIEFATATRWERGDLVLALGNPLGLKHSVTHGIISAKGRLLSSFDASEVLQTDTPINKGNSGGPLFDHLGRAGRHQLRHRQRHGPEPGDRFRHPQQHRQGGVPPAPRQGRGGARYLGAGLLDMEAGRESST